MASAMSGDDAEANVKKATAAAEEAAPKPVVTNPEVAQQITNVFVLISLLIIVMFAYVVYVHFSVDGPLWEAFAWSAGEAPLFIIPLWAILKMRADFVTIYAEEPSDGTAGGDLFSDLLGHEIV